MQSPMITLSDIDRRDEDHKLDHPKDGFRHFVADSIDHNIDTLDGKCTFHGKGIIAYSILNKDIPEKKWNRY